MHETNKVLSAALDRAERLQKMRDEAEDGLHSSRYTVEEQLVRLRADHDALVRHPLRAVHDHAARAE
eukprot:SAG11_NODE_33607_length_276_cov_0.870056_1_plen_66_part_01